MSRTCTRSARFGGRTSRVAILALALMGLAGVSVRADAPRAVDLISRVDPGKAGRFVATKMAEYAAEIDRAVKEYERRCGPVPVVPEPERIVEVRLEQVYDPYGTGVNPWDPVSLQRFLSDSGSSVFTDSAGSQVQTGVVDSGSGQSTGTVGGGGTLLTGTGKFVINPLASPANAVCLDNSKGSVSGDIKFGSPEGFPVTFSPGPVLILSITVEDGTGLPSGYSGESVSFSFTGTPVLAKQGSTSAVRMSGVKLVGPTASPATARVIFSQQ